MHRRSKTTSGQKKKSGYLTAKLKESKEVYGKVFEDGKGRQNDMIVL